MNEGFEQLAQKPLGDNLLASIAQTARDIIAAQDLVVEREEDLRLAKAALRTLQEDLLPELMAEAGQEKLTTADGNVISMKDMSRGTPSRENETEAFEWLRSNGQGGIIKFEIKADLGKADPELTKKALAALAELKINAAARQTVHHQTLGSLVREMLARGDNVPLDLLGVMIWKQAVVKPKT